MRIKSENNRRAFLEFCETVRRLEGDKDRFLDAAHLQRIEKGPTFTAKQLIGMLLLLAAVLLCSVAIICLTVSGKTGHILPALGGTLLAMFFMTMIAMI